MTNTMLSTTDNPFNPYLDFDNWLRFDNDYKYNSLGLVMRFALITDEMSESQEEYEYERAIDEIVKYDPLGIRIKVRKPKDID